MNDFRAIGRRARAIARLTGLSFWKGFQSFYDSDNLTYAASIAYYALLSLFPFLLLAFSLLGRSTVEDATVTLNNEVFADIGMSDEESRTLAKSIETLRRHAGDF